MVVWGKSGSGKSYTLRHVGYEICQTDSGFLLIDGKNVLVNEFGVKSEGGLLDEIISIERCPNLNILEGMPAAIKAQVLLSVSSPDDAKHDIWDTAAGLAAFNAGAIQELLVDMKNPSNVNTSVLDLFEGKWIGVENKDGLYDESFATFKRIGLEMLATAPEGEEHELIQSLKCHAQYKEVDSKENLTSKAIYIDNAISYIQSKQKSGADRINSSIEFTVDSWNSLMVTSEEVLGWFVSTKSDVNILDVLKGKKIGVHIDPRLGNVSKLVQRFLIVKTLLGIQERAGIVGGWESDPTQKQVYFMCDEAQDVLTSFMCDKAAVTRSLGFAYFIATQTQAGLKEKLGEDMSNTFRTHFGSSIWYNVEDPETIATLSAACGKTHIYSSGFKSGDPIDFNVTEQAVLSSPEFDKSHPDREYMTQLGSRSITGNMFKFLSTRKNQAHMHYGQSGLQFSGYLNQATYYRESDKPLDVLSYEVAEQLAHQGMAICKIYRAGYELIDLCKMYGRDENFNLVKS